MAKIRICKEPGCADSATTEGFCRLHYLRRWRKIKQAQRRAAARRLNRYIEHVCRNNPDDYLETIRKDLRSPQFASYVDENFSDEEGGLFMEEAADEEEVERIIKKLKVEEGF